MLPIQKRISREFDEPFLLLAAAIVRQAMVDLKHAIVYGDERKTRSLKKWFLSEYG